MTSQLDWFSVTRSLSVTGHFLFQKVHTNFKIFIILERKTKHNTIRVGHHCAQTNTNNVNKDMRPPTNKHK